MGTDGLQRSLAITLGCLTNIFVYRQSNFWWTSKLYKLPPFEQTLVCLSRIFIGQRMVMNDNHQSSGTLFTPNPYCLPRKAVFLLKRICVSLSHHVFDLPILCFLCLLARSATHNKPFRSKLGTILPASRICLQNQFEALGYPAVCSLPRNGVVSAWHAHSPVYKIVSQSMRRAPARVAIRPSFESSQRHFAISGQKDTGKACGVC